MRDEEILDISPATVVGHLNTPFARALTGEVTWGMA
jgi:hypothetical protein